MTMTSMAPLRVAGLMEFQVFDTDPLMLLTYCMSPALFGVEGWEDRGRDGPGGGQPGHFRGVVDAVMRKAGVSRDYWEEDQ